MSKLAFLVLPVIALACGANVVFSEGGGGSGGGGAEPAYECILGACGEPCTKCVDDICFSGACSEEGRCEPEGSVVCPD